MKNVLILQESGEGGKVTMLLKAMHLGDRIEIYEEVIGGAQNHLATLPLDISQWNVKADRGDA
jgi:hypothetical protein